MKVFFQLYTMLLLLLGGILALDFFYWLPPKLNHNKTTIVYDVKAATANRAVLAKLKQEATEIEQYIKEQLYNSNYCFMIDINIASGRQRFFVYNLKKDRVETAGLVTHGIGSIIPGGLKFSNVSGSNCTSLGRYKVGKAYNGRFGLAYKLYGMDKTNNKAFERFVVLHAHECVPANEVHPLPICLSQGCPTVSPAFLQKLKKYIESSDKPILLNIYQ